MYFGSWRGCFDLWYTKYELQPTPLFYGSQPYILTGARAVIGIYT